VDTKQPNKERSVYWWAESGKLVFLKEGATPEYWDQQWQTDNWKKKITQSRNSRYWSKLLKRYLPDRKSRILEGGCGGGHLVYAMKCWGYDTVGIDFAPATVKKIKENMPDLDVRYGDVRRLEFPDEFFDGYFSLGVIEHLWEGYDNILKEVNRVLRPGGYVFLSFPCMSRLDRVKIFFSGYNKFVGNDKPDDFFQFGLDVGVVRKDLECLGFQCLYTRRQNGWGGLGKLLADRGRIWAWQNKLGARNQAMRFLMQGIGLLLSPLCGHGVTMVLRKQ
jgi:SAM-dependent methyltransferase